MVPLETMRNARIDPKQVDSPVIIHMESLILAQNERWRRGLGMQVEREGVPSGILESGKRVSNAWETCPCVGDNVPNGTLIPNEIFRSHGWEMKGGLCLQAVAQGWSRVPLASWWGNGPPRQ